MSNKLKITLIKSKYGRLKNHQQCVIGLGLRHMHDSRIVENTPENRGMIDKIFYMLKVEEAM